MGGKLNFPSEARVIDVTYILETIWTRNTRLIVSLVLPDSTEGWFRSSEGDTGQELDTVSMSKLLISLQNNGLQLRSNRRLIFLTGINRNGRVGIVTWFSPASQHFSRLEMPAMPL